MDPGSDCLSYGCSNLRIAGHWSRCSLVGRHLAYVGGRSVAMNDLQEALKDREALRDMLADFKRSGGYTPEIINIVYLALTVTNTKVRGLKAYAHNPGTHKAAFYHP